MTELGSTILYWEGVLKTDRFLLEPSVLYFLEQTISKLKELQKLKGEGK